MNVMAGSRSALSSIATLSHSSIGRGRNRAGAHEAMLSDCYRHSRALTLLICGGAGVLSVAMGPDNNWDLRYYHLYAPWAYLHGRYLYDVAPAQYQGFFNPTADLLFYVLISSILNESPRIIAFIIGA